MSAQTQNLLLSFEELLEMENRSPMRHEYIGGRLYAMAGGTPAHAHIITNLTTAVHSRLRGQSCRGSGSDQRVRTSQTAINWYYPDLLIMCPPFRFHPRDSNALLNPRAIFEVLSPATESFDRTAKFDEYKEIENLSDYVLVSAERVRVEHFRRLENGDWALRVYTSQAQELRLDNFQIGVPLGEIYEDVEVEENGVLPLRFPIWTERNAKGIPLADLTFLGFGFASNAGIMVNTLPPRVADAPLATETIRVFIADDHALVREGLRLIIEMQSDMEVIGEAGDGEKAWRAARELRPHVIVMDVSMPELNGAQATERILASCAGTKVLAVSAYQDEAHIKQLLAAGASGYVLKKAASQELANAIRVVAKGGVHLDPSIAGSVVGGYVNPVTGEVGDGGLSPREMEVLMLVAWGHTNREIAAKLHLSVKTIEGHKAKIGEKLRLTTRAEIVRYALRRGWLRDE